MTPIMNQCCIVGTTDITNMVYDASTTVPCLRAYINSDRGRFSDLKVKVGEELFDTHKMIWCQRSKYFETLLHTPLTVVYADPVELKDIEASIFKIILNFMYTNKLDVNCENVGKLLIASNYLIAEETEDYCIEFLQTALTVRNFFIIARFAKFCQSSKLLKITDNFLVRNFVEICSTEEFKELGMDELVAMLSRILRQVSHEKLYIAIVDWVKVDVDQRRSSFGDLFKIIDLTKMSPSFIQQKVATEELLRQDLIRQELTYASQIFQAMSLQEMQRIWIIGGEKTPCEVSVFDVKAKRCVEVMNIPFKHLYGNALDVGDGKVICCGGGEIGASGSNQAHLLTKTPGAFKCDPLSCMKQGRRFAGALLFNDHMYVVGGRNEGDNVDENEVYSIQQDDWKTIPHWNTPRYGHKIISYNGCFFLVGGRVNLATVLKSVECFDLDGRYPTALPPMNCARTCHAVVVIGDDIYAIGGNDKKQFLSSVEKYSSGKWSFVAPMNKARWKHEACVIQGRIFVIGGQGDAGAKTSVEVYDPALDVWANLCYLDKKYAGHSLVVD